MVAGLNFPVPVPKGPREVGKRNWELGFVVQTQAQAPPQLMAIKDTSINPVSF
jgi:hypothetical protein